MQTSNRGKDAVVVVVVVDDVDIRIGRFKAIEEDETV